MGCKCVWCDGPISGVLVNVSGEYMHEDCHRDYNLEISEIIDAEIDVENAEENARSLVNAYALACPKD